jgi:heme A synthase
MIDRIIIPPSLHRGFGELVMFTLLLTALFLLYLAWRKQPLNSGARTLTILSQVVLMGQALLGIKLLDQGMGTIQLYIHYLGGLGPLLFFLLLYWFPSRNPIHQTRWAALAAGSAFVFAILAYTIGGLYARGGLS